jgi:hypothetical protein
VNDPETFWDAESVPAWARERGWFYGDGSFPSKEQIYGEVDRVLQRFPRLRIVFAHFYFLSADLARLGGFLDAHPTVSLDITPGGEMYWNFASDRTQARDFFTAYSDRILFGTDISGGRARDERRVRAAREKVTAMRRFLEDGSDFEWMGGTLRGLALDGQDVGRILAGNFHRWVGQVPARVDRELAVAECGRLGRAALESGCKGLWDEFEGLSGRLEACAG